MDVVLRNVDVSLCIEDLLSLLQQQLGENAVSDIQRFKRTCGAIHKPLPLIRVNCATEERRTFLLLQGVMIAGTHCKAEVPTAPADGAAALGKETTCSDAEVRNVIASVCSDAVLHPDDLPALVVGKMAYVWPGRRGRFRRGSTRLLIESDLHLVDSGALKAWPVVTALSGHNNTPSSEHGAPIVVVTRETIDYHNAVRAEVSTGDRVLEVGCDLGACCAVAATCCGAERVVGIDLSPLSVDRAREAHPSIRFELMDVLQIGSGEARHSLESMVSGKFSKVLIDINGNRDIGAVCRVILVVMADITPAAILVKSRALYDELRTRRGSHIGPTE